jgi:hypothetical protein
MGTSHRMVAQLFQLGFIQVPFQIQLPQPHGKPIKQNPCQSLLLVKIYYFISWLIDGINAIG